MENQEQIEPVETILSFGSLDARALEKPLPSYPELVAAARLQGKVVVEVVVDTQGAIEQAVILSGPPMVHNVVLQAVWRARFAPTRVNGQLVKVAGFLSYDLEQR